MHSTFVKTVLLALVGCGPAVGDEGGTDGGGGSEGRAEGSSGGEASSPPGLLERLEGVVVTDIVVASDGSIAAAGLSDPYAIAEGVFSYRELWAGTFAPGGALRWSATRPRAYELSAVQPTGVSAGADGAVFVSFADYRDREGAASRVSKYDAEGVLLWDTVVGNRPYDVAALGSGGAVTVGAMLSTDASNAVQGWVQVIDPEGGLAGDGVWVNAEGRNSVLNAAVVLPGDELILAGEWGVSPLSSESEPWMVWTGTDLLPTADVRFPSSGDADRLIEAQGLEDGGVLVGGPRGSGGQLLAVSPDGSVSSEELMPEGWRLVQLLSPTAFLATRVVPCGDGAPICPIDDTLAAWDDGVQLWEKTFEGCFVEDAASLGGEDAVVAVRCGSAAELWQVP